MICVSTNSIKTNYSQLRFKRNSDNNSEQKTNQKKTNGSSKVRTGTLITTAAFLAGMGAGKVIMPSQTINANSMEHTITAAEPKESENDKTITWEEATNSTQQEKENTNIPPSSKQRTWIQTTTFKTGDEEHIAVNEYSVREVPFLVKQTVKNAKTKELEQTNTFDKYSLIPTKVTLRDKNNKLIEEREINNINSEYAVPESAKFTSYNEDGSKSITDITYQLHITTKDNRPKPTPKPTPKKETPSNNDSEKAFESLMQGLFE